MNFGIFIHRHDSQYEDRPSEAYQFPRSYLSRASRMIGSYIIYYEPTKVKNSRGYYAIAKVKNIIPDPTNTKMHLAIIEQGSYFEFPNPVPFKFSGRLLELGLYNESGQISGRSQAAVRPITKEDFNRILDHGLEESRDILPRSDLESNSFEVHESQSFFNHGEERARLAYTGNRIIRDKMFRRNVLRAYDERCTITGLKLINGGGRAEVQAAHIMPVKDNGPDSIENGLALSGTVHWMFDRGLISLEDDLEINISRHVNDIDSIKSLINNSGYAQPPIDKRDIPHRKYLTWHREHCFKA